MANQKKKTSEGIHPFGNVLALKNVKDKKTGKGGFKLLFDSVEAIRTAVESLQEFGSMGPQEASVAEEFLNALTGMQVRLLDMCKEKVVGSNILLPPEEEGLDVAPDNEDVLGQKLISKQR